MTINTNIDLPFQGDPLHLRPPSKEFHCNEFLEDPHNAQVHNSDSEDDEEFISSQMVMFQCTLPENGRFLTFKCLEPSCGVLIEKESAAKKEETGEVDPFFFDTGYTLAGKTGFQVWPGSRLMVEALTFPDKDHDCPQLTDWQNRLALGARVMELGSGVGVVGASFAYAGAQVLLTDLKTLVQNSTHPNLRRNSNASASKSMAPSWLPNNAVKIGNGWAASTDVDWTVPLDKQIENFTHIVENVDAIVASDCVWLVKMMEPLFDTIDCVFQRNKNAKLLLSFQRRDTKEGNDSPNFTTVDRVLTTMHKRNWSVEFLAWRPINNSDPKEVFLFEASPLH